MLGAVTCMFMKNKLFTYILKENFVYVYTIHKEFIRQKTTINQTLTLPLPSKKTSTILFRS